MDRGVDQLAAVERNLQDVQDALHDKVKENQKAQKRNLESLFGSIDNIPERVTNARRKHPDVCAIKLLVNPRSL